ncbi:hypothetical protein PR048_009665 [Dryococelus australis]|uniref:Uncharacterized protein n=1 Tax=Dryococelus australis TaxID=614101 RepID=A0ABQ9I0I6_9NEOP|nr:hypothetical protein PR048_009665 [Dryococelus australis]
MREDNWTSLNAFLITDFPLHAALLNALSAYTPKSLVFSRHQLQLLRRFEVLVFCITILDKLKGKMCSKTDFLKLWGLELTSPSSPYCRSKRQFRGH